MSSLKIANNMPLPNTRHKIKRALKNNMKRNIILNMLRNDPIKALSWLLLQHTQVKPQWLCWHLVPVLLIASDQVRVFRILPKTGIYAPWKKGPSSVYLESEVSVYYEKNFQKYYLAKKFQISWPHITLTREGSGVEVSKKNSSSGMEIPFHWISY